MGIVGAVAHPNALSDAEGGIDAENAMLSNVFRRASRHSGRGEPCAATRSSVRCYGDVCVAVDAACPSAGLGTREPITALCVPEP